MQQYLIIEVLLKGGLGAILVAAPGLLAKLFGLPRTDPLWPRLLGAALIGIAAAAFIEARLPATRGLGLGGLVAINLSGAAVLLALLILGVAAPTRRGRIALWLAFAVLALLALAQISKA